VVGAVGDLFLAPGGGFEFFACGEVGDDDEFPWLEAEGGGSEDEGFFEGGPGLFRDFLLGIELFGGVAPLKLGEELGRGYKCELIGWLTMRVSLAV
jgi:hypothetical protein